MARHIHTGKKGEELAVEYFKGMGYVILYRNWRCGHLEVDIIAERDGTLHFIEVKTKTSHRYGFPEDEVSAKKIKNLIDAADVFLFEHPNWEKIQFDVLAITLNPAVVYFLIEDIYL